MGFYRGANVVTDGLILSIDAANPRSYISGSTIWRDLASNLTGSLISASFDSANGGSIVFNGTSTYGDFGRYPAIEAIPAISICHWVKLAETGSLPNGPFLFNTWFPDVVFLPYQFSMNVNDTTFQNSSFLTSLVPLSQWFFACGTYDGDKCRIYMNGVLMATSPSSVPGVTPTGTNLLLLGRKSAAAPLGYLSGSIATGLIYTKALSQSEILQNYNATKARFGL